MKFTNESNIKTNPRSLVFSAYSLKRSLKVLCNSHSGQSHNCSLAEPMCASVCVCLFAQATTTTIIIPKIRYPPARAPLAARPIARSLAHTCYERQVPPSQQHLCLRRDGARAIRAGHEEPMDPVARPHWGRPTPRPGQRKRPQRPDALRAFQMVARGRIEAATFGHEQAVCGRAGSTEQSVPGVDEPAMT